MPQKIPRAKIRWKILASIFWDQDSILLTDYLPKGQTINAEYYSPLLVKYPCSPGTCNPEETGLPGLTMF